MCFDVDSRPPIAPIAGGALDSQHLVLTASDGNRFAAFLARAAGEAAAGAGMIVLPDVRGLYPYYEELALRFAEAGIDAIAIDYFGRTAGAHRRDGQFEFMPHVAETTWAGLRADITAAAEQLRGDGRVRALFTVGFCFGGRVAFLSPTIGIGIAGAIGFYGSPIGAARNDTPPPAAVAERMAGSVLGIFGGADQGIPEAAVAEFGRALAAAGVEHELITYPGAPHSFFDRKAEEFADDSADAWARVLDFVRARTPGGAPDG